MCNPQILPAVSLLVNSYTALWFPCRPEDILVEQSWTALLQRSTVPPSPRFQHEQFAGEKCKLQTCKQLLGKGEEASSNRTGCQFHRCHVCCVLLVTSSESLKGTPPNGTLKCCDSLRASINCHEQPSYCVSELLALWLIRSHWVK